MARGSSGSLIVGLTRPIQRDGAEQVLREGAMPLDFDGVSPRASMLKDGRVEAPTAMSSGQPRASERDVGEVVAAV